MAGSSRSASSTGPNRQHGLRPGHPPQTGRSSTASPEERRLGAHRDCWAATKSGRSRPTTRAQALEALRQQVPVCAHCRPDTVLGLLN
ncbi:DUF6233 domain-containing protein [Streptomyces sp. NPDC049915]|uniref:DUF6233 domain-containing protein n=1 Tax=Streptomyces sp. NPDC049915 TaxID=3155510 RepID=UPI003439089D